MSGARMPLEVLRVEQPCPQEWDAMSGDERSRYCAGCGLHVHNLSAMTRDEAERLVCERAGRLCVRYQQTASGAVVTLDYSPPKARRKWPFWAMVGGAGAMVAAVFNVFATRSRLNPGPVVTMGMMMTTGSVAMPVVPPGPLGPPDPMEPGTACGLPDDAPSKLTSTEAPLVAYGPLGPPAPGSDHERFTAEPR